MRDKKTQITLAVLFFILSFAITMQVKSIIKNSSSENGEITRVEEAKEELVKKDLQIEDLKNRLLAATNDLDNYRKEAEQNTDGAKAMASELERYKILAGLTDVKGKGVTVTLSDSTAEPDAGKSGVVIHNPRQRPSHNRKRTALCRRRGDFNKRRTSCVVQRNKVRRPDNHNKRQQIRSAVRD